MNTVSHKRHPTDVEISKVLLGGCVCVCVCVCGVKMDHKSTEHEDVVRILVAPKITKDVI